MRIPQGVRTGACDLGVGYDMDWNREALEVEPMGSYDIVLLASPDFAEPDFTAPGQKKPVSLVTDEPDSIFRRRLEAYLRRQAIELDVTLELWSIETIKRCVMSNLGFTYLPRFVAAEELADGNRLVRFAYEGIFLEVLERLGKMPLPPYIKEELQDQERYQTVYSKVLGSAAAPTAGLHFTPELLRELESKGVNLGYVTLHVGLGTFRPVKEEAIEDHDMHSEFCTVPPETAELINLTKAAGGRVICVGTTSCRTLESWAGEDGHMEARSGWTNIYLYPGSRFKVMDGLVTNFHLPESTLIMLVSAFAGREAVLAAYREAVKERYRFFSFGDAMFIS